MSIEIIRATTPEHYAQFAELIREYFDWLRARYAHMPWLIAQVASSQALDRELEDVAVAYGPPAGRTFLAVHGADVCGGIAYRTLADGVCEMKRLFIRPEFQRRGLARQLCSVLINAARDAGFHAMRLDTGAIMPEAIALYTALGFHVRSPYHVYPDALTRELVFMERSLDAAPTADSVPQPPTSDLRPPIPDRSRR